MLCLAQARRIRCADTSHVSGPASLGRSPCTPNLDPSLSRQISYYEPESDEDADVGGGGDSDAELVGARARTRDSLLLARQPPGDTSIPPDSSAGSGVSLNPELSVATIDAENRRPDHSDVVAKHLSRKGNRSGFERDRGVRGAALPPANKRATEDSPIIVSKLDSGGATVKDKWVKPGLFLSWDAPRGDVEARVDAHTFLHVAQMTPIGWMTHKGCSVQRVAKKPNCTQKHIFMHW